MAVPGDLEVRLLNVDAEGDLARMIHSINSLLDYTDAFVREARAVLECSAQGKRFRRVLLRRMNGAFHQASTVTNDASHAIPLKSEEVEQQDAIRLRMAGRRLRHHCQRRYDVGGNHSICRCKQHPQHYRTPLSRLQTSRLRQWRHRPRHSKMFRMWLTHPGSCVANRRTGSGIVPNCPSRCC